MFVPYQHQFCVAISIDQLLETCDTHQLAATALRIPREPCYCRGRCAKHLYYSTRTLPLAWGPRRGSTASLLLVDYIRRTAVPRTEIDRTEEQQVDKTLRGALGSPITASLSQAKPSLVCARRLLDQTLASPFYFHHHYIPCFAFDYAIVTT
jgi:hypothetical protein